MSEINGIVEESSTKKKQFEEQLQIINTKYHRWFGKRVSAMTGEEDHINNYFRYLGEGNDIQLYLKEGLPLEIGKDCRLAFENIFKN